MRCFTCKKKGPFWGESCAYCGADKSPAQSLRLAAIFSLIGGCALGAYFRGWPGFIVGTFFGVAAALIFEKILPTLLSRKRT